MRPLALLLLVAMCPPPKGVTVSQEPAPAAQITVIGALTNEGVECPAMREDGTKKLYTLAGKIGDLKAGDRVKVVGSIAERSICMQGTTIEIASIARLESSSTTSR